MSTTFYEITIALIFSIFLVLFGANIVKTIDEFYYCKFKPFFNSSKKRKYNWFMCKKDIKQNKAIVIATVNTGYDCTAYQLWYCPSVKMYKCRCRMFTARQAIRHWAKRKQDNIAQPFIGKRATLFLESIEKHQQQLKNK